MLSCGTTKARAYPIPKTFETSVMDNKKTTRNIAPNRKGQVANRKYPSANCCRLKGGKSVPEAESLNP